jgi:hypothetical protein
MTGEAVFEKMLDKLCSCCGYTPLWLLRAALTFMLFCPHCDGGTA